MTWPSSWCISHISNISRTLVGNEIVDHSDVVGASLVGAASTTSSFPTNTWLNGTGQRQHQDETITISVLGFVLPYMADLTVYQTNVGNMRGGGVAISPQYDSLIGHTEVPAAFLVVYVVLFIAAIRGRWLKKQVHVVLHSTSYINEFSGGCKFVDAVFIMSDL